MSPLSYQQHRGITITNRAKMTACIISGSAMLCFIMYMLKQALAVQQFGLLGLGNNMKCVSFYPACSRNPSNLQLYVYKFRVLSS